MKSLIFVVIWMPLYIVAFFRGCSIYKINCSFADILEGLEKATVNVVGSDKGDVIIMHGTQDGKFYCKKYGVCENPPVFKGKYTLISCYNKLHNDIHYAELDIVRDPSTTEHYAPSLVLPWVGGTMIAFASPEVAIWQKLIMTVINGLKGGKK